MTSVDEPEQLASPAAMEEYVLEYIRSYSRFYSRSESKTLQRCREQLFQEREVGNLVERLARLRGPLADATVLEIGSGSGGRAVAVGLRGAEVVGVEPNEAGLKAALLRAQRYIGLRVEFVEAVGERLPFRDESFDLVFSIEVLQHVQDLERVIAETYRVLKPGGRCYHEAPNNLYPWEFHYRIFWIPLLPKSVGKLYARARGKDPRHLDGINFIRLRPLASMMLGAGFAQVRDLYAEELLRKATSAEGHPQPYQADRP